MFKCDRSMFQLLGVVQEGEAGVPYLEGHPHRNWSDGDEYPRTRCSITRG
ncbi:hypothetical protein LINPERPRIM_LOCUS7985 [Linum perenne]